MRYGLVLGLSVMLLQTTVAFPQRVGVRAELCLWPGGAAEAVPWEGAEDLASVRVEPEGPLRTRIEVTCEPTLAEEELPLALRLDITPRWPHYYLDIAVVDADGQPRAITWRSAERNRILMSVPPVSAVYFLEVTPPRLPPVADEAERTTRDPATGIEATICRWYGGRQAALSLRFDDSHPTHILKAIPLLREHGFTGTFFINPGNDAYRSHAEEWAACAAVGDQEFANHTMHHRGANSDEEADREIGDAARHIWALFPDRSPLLAFSEGGSTVWTHKRPLREVLDRYHLFDAYGLPSISMADVYGERVETFRRALDQTIERGEWFTALFHQIGESISDENFAAVLALTDDRRQSLWIAGMAAVYKYRTERLSAVLGCEAPRADRVRLHLTVGTDPELYDQPLTIALSLPPDWAERAHVTDEAGAAVEARLQESPEGVRMLFDVPPISADYFVSRG